MAPKKQRGVADDDRLDVARTLSAISSLGGEGLKGQRKREWEARRVRAYGGKPERAPRAPFKIAQGMKRTQQLRERKRNEKLAVEAETRALQAVKKNVDARGSKPGVGRGVPMPGGATRRGGSSQQQQPPRRRRTGVGSDGVLYLGAHDLKELRRGASKARGAIRKQPTGKLHRHQRGGRR